MLYDAVVDPRVRARRAERWPPTPPRKDFVTDAFAHCKFIGYVPTADGLLDAAGIEPDDGVIELAATKASVTAFLQRCHDVRFWAREALVDRT